MGYWLQDGGQIDVDSVCDSFIRSVAYQLQLYHIIFGDIHRQKIVAPIYLETVDFVITFGLAHL